MNSNNARFGGFTPAAIIHDLTTAWRLLWDPRVPGILKLALPIFAAVYWVSPIDLLPGIPLDDMAVVILMAKLFNQLAQQSGTANQYSQSQGAQEADDDNSVSTSWQVIDDN